MIMAPINRWWTFVGERFPLGSHLAMVSCFVMGNAGAACLVGADIPSVGRFIVVLMVTLSFFFRLRLFDEIKDLETDRQVNPDRPLARGLIGVPEVKVAIGILTAFEMVATSLVSPAYLGFHLVAVLYSFLMYHEFFVGRWIRPHLTIYAVMHTVVSFFLGVSVVGGVSGWVVRDIQTILWLWLVSNWALFNVFEFARKTFAPEEERRNVESYSRTFGIWGAALLTSSQVLAATGLLVLASPLLSPFSVTIEAGLAALVALASFFAAWRPDIVHMKLFRACATAYLLAYYLVVVFEAAIVTPTL